MTIEEYKKNRKARLQQLSEALDNLPELTDGKAHIEVDAVTGGAKAESEDRAKQVKDALKDKNKETREFIKKQDKDREVEKEDKSENKLMLDESLFEEDVETPNKKSNNNLTEAFSSSATDVIDDLVDRAKLELDENEDWSVEGAIKQAIDDGLIYSEDILALAEHYGVLDYDQMLDAFYEDLYSDMATRLADYDGIGMMLSPEDEI